MNNNIIKIRITFINNFQLQNKKINFKNILLINHQNILLIKILIKIQIVKFR